MTRRRQASEPSTALLRAGSHLFHTIDETHLECVRCELRLFHHAARGWMLVNYWGQPDNVRLLGDGSSSFGSCIERPPSGMTVLIEYTGDPDVYPGCERIMHAVDKGGREEPTALVLHGATVMLPLCGRRPIWWEMGEPRVNAPGWTWCRRCFGSGDVAGAFAR